MGQSMSWLSGLLWAKKEIRILILGLVRTDMLHDFLATESAILNVSLG